MNKDFPIDREKLGEPRRCRAYRGHDRDLVFDGWLLGEGSHGDRPHQQDWTRSTRTKIFLTTGGNVVVAFERRTCWEGERDRNDAQVCHSIKEVLDYMREDGGGEIGASTKDAIDNIDYDPLSDLANEEVE